MEESNEVSKVIPELYFLIAKFLSGGPLKETAKTLLSELERADVLPRRLDWEGNAHRQSYEELEWKFSDVSWRRLAEVGVRALQLARLAGAAPDAGFLPAAAPAGAPAQSPPALGAPGQGPAGTEPAPVRLAARLSLLSDGLVRERPQYSVYKSSHSLVRRVVDREMGRGPAAAAGGRGGPATLSPRLLASLQLQRRTLGHLSAVYCLAFDCTGRYVITGADDLLVKVWSALDGRLLATLRGAGAEITDVCVAPDADLLAAGSVERLVRVWSLRSGAPRCVLAGHQGTITSVHWSPRLAGAAGGSFRWLASTSTDGSVAFWRVTAGGGAGVVQFVERLRPGACHMICAAWSRGGALLAAGSADHHVRLYTVTDEGGAPRRVLETCVHADAVDSLAWAHHQLKFVSGSKDGSAALWSLHAAHWRHSMLRAASADHTKKLKVTMVCWDRSDAFIFTAVSDNTIRVWCSRSCREVRSLQGHRDEAYVLEAHPLLAGVALSGGHDGQLIVWDVHSDEAISRFHNAIPGQGDGAIFDAKWGGACHVAASDSHGHLLLLGLGRGHPLYADLPAELFFHTDYRPLVRDALGGALDEQTSLPPHEMPPAFLVDVEGLPHAPAAQRAVPGRRALAPPHLVPRGPTQLDEMIEVLAAERGEGGARPEDNRNHGVWRSGGVRHTSGAWQHDESLTAPPEIVPPLPPAHRDALAAASEERYQWEVAVYRREMRRRPVMISTAGPDKARRRGGRAGRPARRAPAPAARAPRAEPAEPPEPASCSDSSDESLRLSAAHSASSDDLTYSTNTSSQTGSRSDNSESSYSDWEAGAAALAPPQRTRRRPQPAKRYSPGAVNAKRAPRAAATPARAAPPPAEPPPPAAPAPAPLPPAPPADLAELYRVNEWLTSSTPRKAPYQPQMGDVCLYFRQGHQRYYEAVAEKDLYRVAPRDKPWDQMHIYECELVKVVGIKYEIRPPRLACVRVASELSRARAFTVKYHDMPDVIDFLVLREQYEAALQRNFAENSRFRCMIDDAWWSGTVTAWLAPPAAAPPPLPAAPPADASLTLARFSAACAPHFLCVRAQWDNGELERLSPWDLEPTAPDRVPAEAGGAVPVLPAELRQIVERSCEPGWPAACARLADLVSQVMSLSAAEPFAAPVDLQQYPSYAMVVAYPIDLSTIRARFQNLWYRRAAGAQWDARVLASNAERFNEPRSHIVRGARLLADLLLIMIQEWRTIDVVSKFHELAANYHSSDDEPLAACKRSASGAGWAERAERVMGALAASADAAPFMQPVATDEAPDYHLVVTRPMDLGTVRRRLAAGEYSRAAQFADDVRLVFANSRLYNTNKRTRIYSMTVRLSALFEELWAPPAARRPRRTKRVSRRAAALSSPVEAGAGEGAAGAGEGAAAGLANGGSDSSECEWETLAETSRRVHGQGRGERASGTEHRHAGKGKGVGKKSKSVAPSPPPSTSRRRGRTRSTSWSDDDDPLNVQSSSASGDSRRRPPRKRRRDNRPRHRIPRERAVSPSSSSSSSSPRRAASPARYSSDGSYHPASSDDDAPLTLYRQRQDDDSSAGPSSSRSNGRRKQNGHVRLRAVSPRRYNEQSSDEAAAAISKRAKPPPATHHQRLSMFRAATSDHDYVNGHDQPSSSRPLSISSRGRVRKLTAKARGLLH